MVDPALTQLAWLMEFADMDSVKLAAVKDILDRAGYSAKQKLEHSGSIDTTVDLDTRIAQRLAEVVTRSESAPALALGGPT